MNQAEASNTGLTKHQFVTLTDFTVAGHENVLSHRLRQACQAKETADLLLCAHCPLRKSVSFLSKTEQTPGQNGNNR
jgi:hypothetical protein